VRGVSGRVKAESGEDVGGYMEEMLQTRAPLQHSATHCNAL